MKTSIPVLGLLLALASVGCGRPFVPATPPSFVELNDQKPSYDYRATTADGVVLGARAIDNDPKGTLAFWSEAIERRLRTMGGYALLEKRAVSCLGGMTGTQLRFGHDEGATPHVYVVSIFVADSRIFLLEAGGTKEQMERYADAVDWSVRNFRPKLVSWAQLEAVGRELGGGGPPPYRHPAATACASICPHFAPGTDVARGRVVPAIARALPPGYVPGRPEDTVLYRIVKDHLDELFEQVDANYAAPLLRARSAGRVLVQAPRRLPELRQPPDVQRGRAPHRSRVAKRAHSTMGPVAPVPAASARGLPRRRAHGAVEPVRRRDLPGDRRPNRKNRRRSDHLRSTIRRKPQHCLGRFAPSHSRRRGARLPRVWWRGARDGGHHRASRRDRHPRCARCAGSGRPATEAQAITALQTDRPTSEPAARASFRRRLRGTTRREAAAPAGVCACSRKYTTLSGRSVDFCKSRYAYYVN